MKIGKQLRELLAVVAGPSVHDFESSCRKVGPEACKRCLAMDELRRLLKEDKQ
ncbi:MAG: hypothetical protein M3R04_02450 [bacterium]|nr:hypothetical protein [bacterium]